MSSKNYRGNRDPCLLVFYCLSGAMAASQPSFQSPLWPGLCISLPPNANHMRLPYEFITLTLFYGMKFPWGISTPFPNSLLVLSGHSYSVLLFFFNNNELFFTGSWRLSKTLWWVCPDEVHTLQMLFPWTASKSDFQTPLNLELNVILSESFCPQENFFTTMSLIFKKNPHILFLM